nr:transketolase [Lebetimonas sp. JH369]
MNMKKKMADTIRFLAADMVQKANSGHPGAALGLADIMVELSEVINLTPHNPHFINRDRLVFSGGHATPLIYSMLYLWGYDITMDDLKNFRQLGSITPGHPEFGHTPGIEVTTGPLGQGVANAVGFAMAKKFLHKKFPEIDHKIWCLCGDGDLEEGISYEACSIAGSEGLEDLILIYDSNNISIEGEVGKVFKDDIKKRFASQNFRVLEMNGHDYEDIAKTLKKALQTDGRPTIIIAKTIIARGAVGLEGSEKTHGAPLGEDVIKKSKKAAGFPDDKTFFVPDDVLVRFRCVKEKGELLEAEWRKKANTKEIEEFFNRDFNKIKWPEFEKNVSLATRKSNGEILNAIAKAVPSFLGGSADLAPSNNTHLKDEDDFPHGRNLHFGIREHAMGAINNAFSAYGFLPYAATFLVFSDYLRGALRISALSSHKNYWIFTHDSIALGEDGPTHQPVEHLTALRAIPNLYVFRPADANENVNCWKVALNIDAPVAFALSRQGLKNITPKNIDLSRGAYVLREGDGITILASGSEVNLAVEIAEKINARVVSVPCFDLFDKQTQEFKKGLLKGKVIAIEAARGLEWYKYADMVIGMESFGSSGKGSEVYKYFGFDAEKIINKIKDNK